MLPGQIAREVSVLNVEVPVRVFSGDAFIENLTLNDFEVLEDGITQRIEAVYLIKRAAVERKEEAKRFAPDLSRHFYLFFVLYE